MPAAASLLVVVLLAVLGGCASGSVDLSEYRRPEVPPTYWLGETFEGLELTDAHGGPEGPTFVYGTCESSSNGGCAPPLELQHWPLSKRPPGSFELPPGEPAACRRVPSARVTAAAFATSGGVEVYLGDRVVVLFGDEELIRKARPRLRPVKEQKPALPPPPAWVLESLARCR